MKRVLLMVALMLATLPAYALDLKNFDISGFYQGRTVWAQDGGSAFKTGDFDTARARLKVVAKPTDRLSVTYQGDFSTGTTVTKDMFVSYLAMPNMKVSYGQMVVPFGLEVTQSDLDRETPERALWSRKLFPGERDRGLKVDGQTNIVKWGVGVFSGTGANVKDTNHRKDMSLRLVVPVCKTTRVGLSGWFGTDTATLAWHKPNSPFVDRKLGADVVTVYGPVTLTVEAVKGRQLIHNPWGWDGQVALKITPRNTLVAKFDTFDPNDNEHNKFGRQSAWNLGAIHQLDKNIKLKVFYTRNQERYAGVDNDMITTEVFANF